MSTGTVHERRDDWPWSGGSFGDEAVEALRVKYNLTPEQVEFLKSKRVTADEQHEIMNAEQRTEPWYAARSDRITASNYAAAIGHNPYETPDGLVKSMLWRVFQGNAATEWGKEHEDDGAAVYERYMKKQRADEGLDPEGFKCTFPGLIVPESFPWAGCSPDGFVWIDGKLAGGLEIKCPFRRQLYPFIPAYYYDQIQGTMGFLGMKWWDFVVWTPEETQIRRFMFDETYWKTVMYPRLEEFYMTKYMPATMLKAAGRLEHGCIVENENDALSDDDILDVDLKENVPKRPKTVAKGEHVVNTGGQAIEFDSDSD